MTEHYMTMRVCIIALIPQQFLQTFTDGSSVFETVPSEGYGCNLIRRLIGERK